MPNIEPIRRGESSDRKIAMALRLAVDSVRAEGKVDPQLLGALKDAGYSR